MNDNLKECPACGDTNGPDETGCLAGTYQYQCACGEVYYKISQDAPLPWDDPPVETVGVDHRTVA